MVHGKQTQIERESLTVSCLKVASVISDFVASIHVISQDTTILKQRLMTTDARMVQPQIGTIIVVEFADIHVAYEHGYFHNTCLDVKMMHRLQYIY